MQNNIIEAGISGVHGKFDKIRRTFRSGLIMLILASCQPDRVISPNVLMQYLGSAQQGQGESCDLRYKGLGIASGRGETKTFHPLDTPIDCTFGVDNTLLKPVP